MSQQEVWYTFCGSGNRSRETKAKNPGVWGRAPAMELLHATERKQKPHFHHALTRKQTMSGSEVSLTCVMVSLTRFWQKNKGDLIIIVANEILRCPCCEGELFVRGTCHRQAINSAGIKKHYLLRVLQCRDCHRTHRELPAPLVPYKRYDGEAITYIESNPSDAPCNTRTVDLILRWLAWFISYAKHICESQSLILSIPLPKASGETRLSEFMSLVRIVVNSGNWLHNRTEFFCA